MIETSKPRVIWLASIAAATFLIAQPAFSQAPTDAQRSAIRAQCRPDYEAHCASVPPGGMASLQCLQKNMSSLSPGCQSAVRAVEAPAESKTEPAPAAAPNTEPATAPTKPAAETAAPAAPKAAAVTARKPSSAQVTAIRSACRSDFPKVCDGVPTGGAAALQCLEKNKSQVSAACQKAVVAASGGAATPTGGGGAPAVEATADPAAAPAVPVLVLRPMLPREELFVLRSACGFDVRALCAGVQPGGGRIMQCLAVQSASLSPDCRDILSRFAAQ
jgi:Cysteine rich repeat